MRNRLTDKIRVDHILDSINEVETYIHAVS